MPNMDDEGQDYELQRTFDDSDGSVAPSRPIGLWIAAALLAVAAAGAAYFVMARRAIPAEKPAAPAAAKEPPRPLGGDADAIEVPPLAESDPLVRMLVRALSESPAIATWLTTNGLIRNFTVVVANVAEGATPAKHLAKLRPTAPFRVSDRSGATSIDPRSYDRYRPIADAVSSVDPAGAVRLYTTLKPRIEEAYRELGVPDESFDRPLERAIVTLLSTPSPGESVRVKPKGIGYSYADERLENLTAAQKQLLRMGPVNVRVIKDKLRAIAVALGIPSERLPAN